MLESEWMKLGEAAWEARGRARHYGPTAVGAGALDEQGQVHVGCNIEHRFRSHDIHAEVAAISSLVAGGGGRLVAILIAAERDKFTPCGACMDWIMEAGGGECEVGFQGKPGGPVSSWRASELMPHYPG